MHHRSKLGNRQQQLPEFILHLENAWMFLAFRKREFCKITIMGLRMDYKIPINAGRSLRMVIYIISFSGNALIFQVYPELKAVLHQLWDCEFDNSSENRSAWSFNAAAQTLIWF
jgi:hypothetical protein